MVSGWCLKSTGKGLTHMKPQFMLGIFYGKPFWNWLQSLLGGTHRASYWFHVMSQLLHHVAVSCISPTATKNTISRNQSHDLQGTCQFNDFTGILHLVEFFILFYDFGLKSPVYLGDPKKNTSKIPASVPETRRRPHRRARRASNDRAVPWPFWPRLPFLGRKPWKNPDLEVLGHGTWEKQLEVGT